MCRGQILYFMGLNRNRESAALLRLPKTTLIYRLSYKGIYTYNPPPLL